MRRVALVSAGLFGLTRGIAYLGDGPSSLPGGLDVITTYLPLELWAALWCSVPVLVALAWIWPRLEKAAWGALVGMMLAWSLAYLAGWLVSMGTGDPSREWLNASTYGFTALTIAALVAYGDRRPPVADSQE